MSIILEALRKSERERRLGQIPTLDSGTPVSGSRRGFLLHVGVPTLLAVLLAGGAYRWLSDRPAAIVAVPPSASVSPEPVVVKAQPWSEPGRPAAPPAPVPERERTQEASAGQELPAALRATLPALTLNALSWAEDARRRFVMINQAIAREGQSLPGGITLREITREGAVLEYQGRRFVLRP
jgi:general secretion pathway protein B